MHSHSHSHSPGYSHSHLPGYSHGHSPGGAARLTNASRLLVVSAAINLLYVVVETGAGFHFD